MTNIEERKKDHIELTEISNMQGKGADSRFNYEPILGVHADFREANWFEFAGKEMKHPLWISSMTGGAKEAGKINHNLASLAGEYGLGMGLGSCRSLLFDEKHWKDFDLRPVIGERVPFYANLGICQVEELILENKVHLISNLIEKLHCDGLIVHINPLQEWFQPEGDRLRHSPLLSLKRLMEEVNFPIIVKEVGQGMGPKSLRELLKLNLKCIDFAAYGGTNFSRLEELRVGKESADSLVTVGHTAEQMVFQVNEIIKTLGEEAKCREVIISGGVRNYLDGFYLTEKCQLKSVYAQASSFLKCARGPYEDLKAHLEHELEGFYMAKNFLTLREC